MLEAEKQLLNENLSNITKPIQIHFSPASNDDSNQMATFIEEVANLSPMIEIVTNQLNYSPSFGLSKPGEQPRICFAGIPLNHELDSFIAAVLLFQEEIKVVKPEIQNKLDAVDQDYHFESYVSLSCHNCPVIVQSLNRLAYLHESISHTMIDGMMHNEQFTKNSVLSVPTVYMNGKYATSGRKNFEQLLDLITQEKDFYDSQGVFDTLIIGGGPAACSAAIFSARKGHHVGIVAEIIGGKVLDIPAIENIVGIPFVVGESFMNDVNIHVNQYAIETIEGVTVKAITKDKHFIAGLNNGHSLKAKTMILALGATWQKLGVKGEADFTSKGISNCPHCDGPLFSGKTVAIIGSGNQAAEGALDLASYTKKVYLLLNNQEMQADKVLQDRMAKLDNLEIIKERQIEAFVGSKTLEGIKFEKQENFEDDILTVDGAFVQTKLTPNTKWLEDFAIELNDKGEIKTDGLGSTNIEGLFAAGDCIESKYKQIVIAISSGAVAALSAHDYLIS